MIATQEQVVEIAQDIRTLAASGADLLGTPGIVAIDTETTGLNPWGGDLLRGISVAYRLNGQLQSWYLPVSHPASSNPVVAPVIEALNKTDLCQVYHHGTFDWAFLEQVGLKPPEHHRDTHVMAWMLNENEFSFQLKQLASKNFGFDAAAEQKALKKIMGGATQADAYKALRATEEWGKPHPAAPAREEAKRISAESKKGWADLTADDIGPYAAMDAELTLKLYELEREWIDHPLTEADVRPDEQREHDFQGVLYRMMKLGIRIDQDAARRQADIAHARLAVLAEAFEGTNLNAPAQLAHLIYDTWGVECSHFTDGGARSTAKAALEELEGQHEGVDMLLEFRSLQKSVSTYYEPLLTKVGTDGRVHTSLHSARTVTGRLSSSDPNLQNIPLDATMAGVRDIFIPHDGLELWEYDLSAAELRIMSSFAKEETMMSALEEGRDLHSETAEGVFGPNFTPLQRRLGKNLNYGWPYGIGPKKFARYMVAGTGKPVELCEYWRVPWWERRDRKLRKCSHCTVCGAARILNGYEKVYPRLAHLKKYLEKAADEDGFLPLHQPGRYRRFRSPGVRVPNYTALNALVQGGVAELMKTVMIQAESSVREYARMVLQVHDSLVIEVVPGRGPWVGEVLQTILNDVNPFAIRMVFDSSPWSAHA